MEDEGSSFDMKKWVLLFLRHWYLFVIGVVLCVGLALLKNRSVLPSYETAGTILIQEMGQSSLSGVALLHGYGLGQEYRNVTNQVVMLRSYDLMREVVDSLPFMHTDYISMGRFRTRNLYYGTPIYIEKVYLNERLYDQLFRIDFDGQGGYTVTLENKDVLADAGLSDFEIHGRLGELVEHEYLSMTMYQAHEGLLDRTLYFRMRSTESLIAEFSGRLQMDFVAEESTVLAVRLVGETPARDKDFIDMFFNIHAKKNLAKKNDAAVKTIEFIDDQLQYIAESLHTSEASMIAFRQENQLVDVSSHAGELMQKAVGYDEKELTLQLRETYLDYLDKYLKSRMETGTIVAPSSLGLNEPLLMSLVQELNELQLKLNEVNDKNVFHAMYAKDIANVKEAISEVVKSMRASLELDKNDVKERKRDLELAISKLPAKELQMLSIERQYRIDDNYYTFFLQKRAETEIQKASNTPDNDVLDEARLIGVVNADAKMKTYLIFLLLGIAVPSGLLILIELLNSTIRTDAELKAVSAGIPQLGTVYSAMVPEANLIQTKPRSSYAEMFRRLRIRIEFAVQRKNKISILVTSTHSKDGKTFFSANLAAIYSMTKQRTLLIDMDIRKPDVHRKLDMKAGDVGLTNYLIGEASLKDILHTDTDYGYDVIFAGTIPPNPGELIRSAKLQDLLAQLKDEYDYIVIDTSPVGLVSDAQTLMGMVDVNLYIVRSGFTNKKFCETALTELKDNNVQHLYTVLNGVDPEQLYGYGYARKGYGYSKKGGYYSQYGEYYTD